jgi:hypothetical protein
MGCGASTALVSDPTEDMDDMVSIASSEMERTTKSNFAGLEHETGWAGWENVNGPKTPHQDNLWSILPAALQTMQLSGFQSTLGLTLNDFGEASLSHQSMCEASGMIMTHFFSAKSVPDFFLEPRFHIQAAK